jgi:glycosyltransferase involved in cell wall biosynthesis
VVDVSVVVPVYNGGEIFASCLRSLFSQTLPRDRYEVIVVDDGSTDGSGQLAASFGAKVLTQRNAGAPAARNAGLFAARGRWVAFTDADCIPSRRWLQALLTNIERDPQSIGAAGKTTGYRSETPAARFVDLMSGLDAASYLRHPVFPFAPTGNVMYRRAYLMEIGGFETRYATYDACDLHTRLLERYTGAFAYEPSAVVLHRHRTSWKAYWRQQYFYGVGYAQFLIAHRDRAQWRIRHQLAALAAIAKNAIRASLPARGDDAIVRRGTLIRTTAQHAGFLRTYYSVTERRRW